MNELEFRTYLQNDHTVTKLLKEIYFNTAVNEACNNYRLIVETLVFAFNRGKESRDVL